MQDNASQQPQTEPGWTYQPPAQESVPQYAAPPQQPYPATEVPVAQQPLTISWTASEFLQHHKPVGWYIAYAGVVSVFCGLMFLIIRDVISVVSVAVVAILFIIIAAKKPRQLTYEVTDRGIHVGQRFYDFVSFKSFSVEQVGALGFLYLIPLKRLQPEVSVAIPPENAQAIFDIISQHVPHEIHKDTIIDKFTRAIRF